MGERRAKPSAEFYSSNPLFYEYVQSQEYRHSIENYAKFSSQKHNIHNILYLIPRKQISESHTEPF